MAFTWISSVGTLFQHSNNAFSFRGSPDDVESFFFYFQNVATRASSSEVRAVELIAHLSGEAFEFCYEEYAENSELSAAGMDYVPVKKAYI